MIANPVRGLLDSITSILYHVQKRYRSEHRQRYYLYLVLVKKSNYSNPFSRPTPYVTVQEPVSGLADIRAKIEHLGLGGAMVDLGCGSVDAQPSEGG